MKLSRVIPFTAATFLLLLLLGAPKARAHGRAPTPFATRLPISASQFSPALSQPSAVAQIADFLEEKIYIADTGNNRVIKVTLPETITPDVTWDSMKTSLSVGNLNQAISHFSSATAEEYRRSFILIGSAAVSAVTGKTLIPAVVNGDRAQYYFEDDGIVPGETLTFPVEFVKENGVWKILEF